MLRTYEFYEKNFKLYKSQVDRLCTIIGNVENGIYNEKDIRSLGKEGLLFCICEGKYDVFKTLVSPFSYKDGNKERFRYLLDAVTLGVVRYIRECPQSIMEHWVKVNENEKRNAEFAGEEFFPIPVEYSSKDAVVLFPSLKKELIDAVLSVDKDKILTTKIKDVLAKQISGTCHPITCIQDVVYYAELPLLYPCIDLFKKNIITKSNDTGGCYEDYVSDESQEFIANLIVDYDSLDETNKVVADALIESGNAHIFENKYADEIMRELVIEVPCKRDETVYQVTRRMMELVSKFHKQDMLYGQLNDMDFYNMFCNWFSILSDENVEKVNAILLEGYDSENILKVLEYFTFIKVYYDSVEDKFWTSEYYYNKHKQYLEEQQEFGSIGLK